MEADDRINRLDDAVRQGDRANAEMIRRMSVLEEKLHGVRNEMKRLSDQIDKLMQDKSDSLKRMWFFAMTVAIGVGPIGFEIGRILEISK